MVRLLRVSLSEVSTILPHTDVYGGSEIPPWKNDLILLHIRALSEPIEQVYNSIDEDKKGMLKVR
jgi:hypothetical protein